MMGKI